MSRIINARQLRASLPEIVRRTRRGERFVVLYRSRPAFQIAPVDQADDSDHEPFERDSLYGAEAVGNSADGLTSKDHDRTLYGGRR
jgi:antitoxin (DNA-binding transcriptional repressor) of toxin-antitoxin stability system